MGGSNAGLRLRRSRWASTGFTPRSVQLNPLLLLLMPIAHPTVCELYYCIKTANDISSSPINQAIYLFSRSSIKSSEVHSKKVRSNSSFTARLNPTKDML
jgi:hypothetical protein